jgi:hypothetical protein
MLRYVKIKIQKLETFYLIIKIKTKMWKSMIFERKELFKYTRESTNSEWQKTQSPKSTKSFKLELLQLRLS